MHDWCELAGGIKPPTLKIIPSTGELATIAVIEVLY
jgi:hypothetical protein